MTCYSVDLHDANIGENVSKKEQIKKKLYAQNVLYLYLIIEFYAYFVFV